MRKLPLALLAGAVVLTLSSCGSLIADPADESRSPQLPQSDATSEDYQHVVDAAEQVLADADDLIPKSAIARVEVAVNDLETDYHRMPCGDSTSQYTNTVDYYLAAGTDEIVLLDEFRDVYEAQGWQRGESVAEQMGKKQNPEGSYGQLFRSPDGYSLDASRGDDGQGGVLVQLSVYSPCIGNPTDKPSSWGKF